MGATLLPYLRVPCFADGREVRFAHRSRSDLDAGEVALVQRVFDGGATLDDLADDLVERGAFQERSSAAAHLKEVFSDPENAIGLVAVELPGPKDVVLVEQGYGGVYVHSVELFKKLRERWKCLLVSPVEPLFEPEEMEDVLTLERLKKKQPDLDLGYFAWIQIVRTLVKRTRCRLLLLMHRSQSLYLFDLLDDRRTVIYCDGFYDGAFRRANDFHLDDTPDSRRRVLAEIHYLTSNSDQNFMGFTATPGINVKLLMAGAFSLTSAVENWCWGAEQRAHFTEAFPDLQDSIRLMLPFTDSDLFDRDAVTRDERLLFTTTMHNIDKKGLPELVRAMGRVRSLRAHCIVRQPEHLPAIPPGVRSRMDIRSVPKAEMVRLYHSAWLNCRTSREESSPMSILESMSCELPQVVSPAVAAQIPIIEDGATGFVVHPDDTDRLVWALRTLLGDRQLRDRMGRECRRRALTLSFTRRVEEFERLLS